MHQLELKFLPIISTNFDGNFQSTVLKVISPIFMSKWMWPSGLRRQFKNLMIGMITEFLLQSYQVFLENMAKGILITFCLPLHGRCDVGREGW